MFVAEELVNRRRIVRDRIAAAGGDIDRVKVIAVTKGFDVGAVRAAKEAGFEDVGENYAQEARAKWDEMQETNDPQLRWHFIGQLQRNKVKLLAPFVDVWQTVDNDALIDEIAKRAAGARVLIQVNLSEEPGRGGCDWDDVAGLVERARQRELDVLGLMGVGPLAEAEASRPGFRRLAQTAAGLGLDEVSMGMSGDYEIAVEEGATMVRLGSTFFGQRPLRHPGAG